MPGMDRPLNRHEIAHVLRGIHDAPPGIPSTITSTALSATVNGLALWCDQDDVERARAQVVRANAPDLRSFIRH